MGNSSSKAASAASKAAAGAARRQYPSSASTMNSATSTTHSPSVHQQQPSPSSHPSSQICPDPTAVAPPPSDTKSKHIDLDGRDPQFASSLRKLGPAVPKDVTHLEAQSFPTSSQPPLGQHGKNIFPPSPSSQGTTSSSNPSLKIVQARERIAAQFRQETENMGRSSFSGRTLISAREISDIISLRTQGKGEAEIEKQLRLKTGLVSELVGQRRVVENI